ncbi:MAG: hypothetical protein J5958_06550 [Clostridia bacterium]|nr:hypothetical protein [Clostridia bacterium]
MTMQDLITNLEALGIGIGSTIADGLDKPDISDPRLCAIINSGVADLFKVRPRRGAVTVDLAAAMESDGTVNVYNAITNTAERARFSRLDGFSVAEEDAKLFGIMRNAWTGDRLLHVGAMPYVKRIQAENAAITDVSQKKQLPVTITYRKKPVEITVNELSGSDTFEIDLDDDLADILPSYVASYLYLEENEGKAKYYRSIYETRRSEIASREYNHPEASRTVFTNGW